MPTKLTKNVARQTHFPLAGNWGPDKGRRLVVTLKPGTDQVPDLLELRPEGTRHPATVALVDVYSWLVRRQAGA